VPHPPGLPLATMKYTALTALIAVLCNFGLTFFVVTRDPRSVVNRIYFLWGIAVTMWNFGEFFLLHAASPERAMVWAYVLHCGVILLPITNLHLTLLISQVSIGRWLWAAYAYHAALIGSLFLGTYITGVREFEVGYYSIPGPGFWLFMVSYSLCTSAIMVMLYHKQRQVAPLHRTRLRSLLLAYTILLVAGTNDLMPILGYDFYPYTHIPISRFGNIATVFYVIVIAYSVLQHQLLDLHVTLSKSAAHTVRMLFLFFIGFVLMALLATVAREQFTPFSFFSALAVLLASAGSASVLFPRLFGSGVERLERRILGDRFEYHAKIKGFVASMQWFTDSTLLLNALHDLLVKIVKVRSYQIILLQEKTRTFSLFRSYPEGATERFPKLHGDSPIFQFFQESEAEYLAFKGDYAAPSQNDLEGQVREQFHQFDPEFCFPLFFDDEPFGLFLIGEKISAELYTPHDLELLTGLVKDLSGHLNQIRLKNQLLLAQEMELLGMMSRGMAHDLNNLITPIWTYLQLAAEHARPDQDTTELLPTVTRNVATIRSYIREALFFSNTQTPELASCNLAETVRKAIQVTRPQLEQKQLVVDCDGLPEIELELDAVLIQRLISNLLSNAMDASPAGDQIKIRLFRLETTEKTRQWYRLQVIDHGEGISRDNLKQVFIPYFTTKDHGDERRGFGLGLAICRKIVHLHGGNLNIASQEKKGTTVEVDLPSRQVSKAAPTIGKAA
jgi:signal transduction histidine kinase